MKVGILVNWYVFSGEIYAKISQPAILSLPLSSLFSLQMTKMWKRGETPTRDFLLHFS